MSEVTTPNEFASLIHRLHEEFHQVHPESVVSRCVAAARHGALDVTGDAAPDLVERVARQHLRVLVDAEAT